MSTDAKNRAASLRDEALRLRSVAANLESKIRGHSVTGEPGAPEALRHEAERLLGVAASLEPQGGPLDARLGSKPQYLKSKPLGPNPLDFHQVSHGAGVWLADASTGVIAAVVHRGTKLLQSSNRWHAYVISQGDLYELGAFLLPRDAKASCWRRMEQIEHDHRVDSESDRRRSHKSPVKSEAAPRQWCGIGPHLWMPATTIGTSFFVYHVSGSSGYQSYAGDCGQNTDLGNREKLLEAKADCQTWHELCQEAIIPYGTLED